MDEKTSEEDHEKISPISQSRVIVAPNEDNQVDAAIIGDIAICDNNSRPTHEDLYPQDMPENYKPCYDKFLDKVLAMEEPVSMSLPQDAIKNFKFFNERYFENYYSVNDTKSKSQSDQNDILVRVHSNKLIVLALARGHTICSSGKRIKEINFVVNKTDRSIIKPKGKRKLGSKEMAPGTILCQVKLEGDENPINIRAGVPGYLVEVNEIIKQKPNLLIDAPTGLGYLGIMLPKGKPVHFKETVNSWGLLTEESYMQCLDARVQLKV